MAKPNLTAPANNAVYSLDRLPLFCVDLAKAKTKAELLKALAAGLQLPAHFGNNWDALADCLMDDEWIGEGGCVVALSGARVCAKSLKGDFATLQDLLSETADHWKDQGKVFSVLLG